jgi:tetratricopeptide (TPR) repeat protein
VRFTQQLLREVNTAIALNPNDDAAYSIKGSLFRAIGNVSWLQRSLASVLIGRIPSGGFADAEAALRKAIELAPDVMRHQYELGILYIDMDRKEDARKALEAAALLPVRVAIDRPRLAKIKELLQQLSQE